MRLRWAAGGALRVSFEAYDEASTLGTPAGGCEVALLPAEGVERGSAAVAAQTATAVGEGAAAEGAAADEAPLFALLEGVNRGARALLLAAPAALVAPSEYSDAEGGIAEEGEGTTGADRGAAGAPRGGAGGGGAGATAVAARSAAAASASAASAASAAAAAAALLPVPGAAACRVRLPASLLQKSIRRGAQLCGPAPLLDACHTLLGGGMGEGGGGGGEGGGGGGGEVALPARGAAGEMLRVTLCGALVDAAPFEASHDGGGAGPKWPPPRSPRHRPPASDLQAKGVAPRSAPLPPLAPLHPEPPGSVLGVAELAALALVARVDPAWRPPPSLVQSRLPHPD